MAHEVLARIDTKVVVHKDLEITVKANGKKLGTLLISKGNVEWMASGAYVKKQRLSWTKFAEVMSEHGRTVRVNK